MASYQTRTSSNWKTCQFGLNAYHKYKDSVRVTKLPNNATQRISFSSLAGSKAINKATANGEKRMRESKLLSINSMEHSSEQPGSSYGRNSLNK